jgi:quercetin dioxygenase-like cupin family protein
MTTIIECRPAARSRRSGPPRREGGNPPRTSAVPPIAAALAALAILGTAAQVQACEKHHTAIHADAVKWGPAPPSLPPGAQAAALFGSPAKAGPFVIRLKLPAGFVVPPHRHSKDEFVTVISGKFGATSGEKVDRASHKALPAGSFVHLPAGMPHYAWAEGETVVQINGVGPFDVIYVNPKDDPRKK